MEEPIYDAALFVHYTATIIEHMGGRGAGVVPAAERIYEQWAGNHHFEMYDDVAPVLTALAARGVVLGVISNSHRSLDAFREHFQLESLITTAVSSAEHGYMKPHRSIFDTALAQAGVRAGRRRHGRRQPEGGHRGCRRRRDARHPAAPFGRRAAGAARRRPRHSHV